MKEHCEIIKSKYRLYPIIIGYRCEGYELQKERKTLFGKKWKAVKGEGGKIRLTESQKLNLRDIINDLENLANHLSYIKYIDLNHNEPISGDYTRKTQSSLNTPNKRPTPPPPKDRTVTGPIL